MTASDPLHPALDRSRHCASQGDAAGAVQHARDAAKQAEQGGDLRGLAEARSLLAQQLFALGRAEAARHEAAAARAAWQQLGEPDREFEVLVQMAMALSERGAPAEAMAVAEDTLALVRTHALEARLPRVLAVLGALQGELGEWAESETLMLQSLSLARDRHDTAQVVSTMNALLMHLGHAQEAQQQAGHLDEAKATQERLLQHARRALALSAEEPQPFRRAVLRGNAGHALLVCGQPDEAAPLLADTLQQALQHGYRAVVLRTRLRLARACLAQGRGDAAAEQAHLLQAELDAEDLPQARQELQALREALALLPGARPPSSTGA